MIKSVEYVDEGMAHRIEYHLKEAVSYELDDGTSITVDEVHVTWGQSNPLTYSSMNVRTVGDEPLTVFRILDGELLEAVRKAYDTIHELSD